MLRHVNVRRKNGEEQQNESDSGGLARPRDENAEATCNFRNAADDDQQRRRRKRRRNNLLVECRVNEVVCARGNKECPEQDPRYGFVDQTSVEISHRPPVL